MVDLWTPFEQRQIVSPIWVLFTLSEALILLPSIAAFHPTSIRTVASSILFATITWTALRYRFNAPFAESYLFFSLHGTMLCNWVDRVVLQHPDKQQWHKITRRSLQQINRGGEQDTTNLPHSYWVRLMLSLESMLALRGVGWSFQVKNVPQPPPIGYNRWKFVLVQLMHVLVFKFLDDEMKVYAASMPFGGYWNEAQQSGPKFLSLPLHLQLISSWMCALQIWTGMNMVTSLVYALAVAMGVWEPHQCPPIFGNWKQFYTVRKAWSIVWHQLCRRIATTAGLFLARTTLNLQPGTFSSRYVQLFAGFLATGISHSMGSVFAVGHDLGDMRFFITQAVAIMAEDHVISFGRRVFRLKESRFWRIVGFCWVMSWFSYSFRYWYGPQVEAGFWVNRRGTDWLELGSRSEL